jgi:hypothetical protein
MGEHLLVNEHIDAGAEFVRSFNDYVPVSVACWVNPADAETWYLYVASDQIDDRNILDAYGEVHRRLAAGQIPWLNMFQVKLVSSSDRVARDAIRIRDRFPTPVPTRYQESSLGGLAIDGAYIYPPLVAQKTSP